MKQVNASLAAHLSEEVTTLATCWKLTLRDGVVLGFTNHDDDISLEGVLYQAASGFIPTAIAGSSDLAVDNLDVEGVLDAVGIKQEDLIAGRYDFAEVDIFIVNYQDLSQGSMSLRTGWIGEVQYGNSQFVAEIRGLTQKLSQTIGSLFSPSCRAIFGDARCEVDLSTLQQTGIITGVEDRRIFSDSGRLESDNYFRHGLMQFTDGLNIGQAMEVKSFSNGTIVLVLPMPFDVSIGDGYIIDVGCDKTFGMCVDNFANAVNFRGEPHVPGTDRLLQTSSTRN